MKQRDPLDLAGQERDRDDKQRKGKVERDEEAADFKWLMSDARGRRFMWRLLGLTGLYRNPFTGNSETFFRCGSMSIGQNLLAQITELAPEAYLKMIEEHRSK
jgi:hypothetical protein